MSEWTKVRWTQARQVTQLMGVRDRDAPAEGVAPRAHCTALATAGELSDAVTFVGHALPRYESVAWATSQVAAARAHTPAEPAEQAVFDLVAEWVKDPNDSLRRAAFDAARALDEAGPEQMLGFATYYSGGSIAPEGVAPVLPKDGMCNRFASTAVVIAAGVAGERAAALQAALAAGEAVASGAPAPQAAG
ncbi:DUF6931 family protein [Sphingomonas jatrophae]|uniref:Uncharacterized protein n=1 Tax=Sphingomonas jatrophae TaxID=1166337 RepID=A0A1I6LK46_9SPHN|nr:hypothetical protein [Sphingomonas jatrophae]SFS03816.1 hypothetical protein SAMN05192580_2836 [Sphingomonas jatrophae]